MFEAAHRRLFLGTRDDAYGGIISTRQNWIWDATSPVKADFLPPPRTKFSAS
jgi:hypothetical protein